MYLATKSINLRDVLKGKHQMYIGVKTKVPKIFQTH